MKEIKAKVYPAEYIDCVKMNYLMSRKFNPENFVTVFGLLLVFITGIVISFLLWINNENSSMIFFLIVISVMCLCVFLDFDRKIRRNARLMLTETAKDKYPRYYSISEEGFYDIDTDQNINFKWTDYNKYIFSKNYILLFDSEKMLYFIARNYYLEDFQILKEWVIKSKVKAL